MQFIEITLSPHDLRLAALTGCERQIYALRHGSRNRHGLKGWAQAWSSHILGACGELAVAKALDLCFVADVTCCGADDVGTRFPVDVRATPGHGNRLIVHPSDEGARVYVLVTGTPPTFRIHGWILGEDAKRPEFWADPTTLGRGAFFVPQAKLAPIAELQDTQNAASAARKPPE